jgi:serine/threonine protein kinase
LLWELANNGKLLSYAGGGNDSVATQSHFSHQLCTFLVKFSPLFDHSNRRLLIPPATRRRRQFRLIPHTNMGGFDGSTARFFAGSVVLCLQYLHKMSVAYRDLKPENLLVSQDGYLKVTLLYLQFPVISSWLSMPP